MNQKLKNDVITIIRLGSLNLPVKHINYEEDSIFTSKEFWKFKKVSIKEPVPLIMFLSFSDSLFDLIISNYKNRKINGFFGDLRVFKEFNYNIGILGKFGIGGPVTAVLTEDLKHWGVNMIFSLGFGSSLQPNVQIGDFILVEKALRDEGTSYHYSPPTEYAFATENLISKIKANINFKSYKVHTGTVWTTDAIYRETKTEIQKYQSKNILAVEMETSTLYTVCNYCKIQCFAIICISDSISSLKWEFKNNLDKLNQNFLILLKELLEFLQNEFI